MLKDYQIIDADCHVVEPTDLWERYLEPAFKSRAPSSDLKVEGEEIVNKISDEVNVEGFKQIMQNNALSVLQDFNADSQVRVIKEMGIDIAFLYPTRGLWLFAVDTMEPKLVGAFIRAYNNWLRDFCSSYPQIFRGVGAINRHEPNEMVSELRRIAEFGWKAVVVRPNPIKGRLLSDPAYEPFWNECEQLGIAVSIHEGAHARVPSTGADRFDTRFAMHACSHPMEQMMALLALIEGGVLERHPKLRVGFLESGCGWVPYWLWRLDREYKDLAWEVKDNVKMKPSEYFRRQCFVAMEPSEPYLPDVINYIGTDNLILGSDYPHMDHEPNIIKDTIALEDRLSKKTVQKILWDNPMRFYGLD
ncbi:MAG: amidohydrolase [Candidatus Parabeggiatoa sp. nov. 2]|nr:MAG: BarH protein [Beggiatoa sp. 4572_84]RKZ60620.1 MAG: amidohydrolase [Gammaproteobacteria bacterium]